MLGSIVELERLIQEKRSELRAALSAHQKAREAAGQLRNRLSELRLAVDANRTESDLEALCLAEAKIQGLESAEQKAAIRFNAISDELAHLHRQKYGVWHITWEGPLLRP